MLVIHDGLCLVEVYMGFITTFVQWWPAPIDCFFNQCPRYIVIFVSITVALPHTTVCVCFCLAISFDNCYTTFKLRTKPPVSFIYCMKLMAVHAWCMHKSPCWSIRFETKIIVFVSFVNNTAKVLFKNQVYLVLRPYRLEMVYVLDSTFL